VLIFQALLATECCIERAGDFGGPRYEVVAVCSVTAVSARSKAIGSIFPRFAARRRMPLQAVALKKNRCGTSPVSKISDNEHTAAALCHSGVLSVKNSVGEPIPEFCQHPEEGSKIASAVR
jgi:hypothetical protein